MTSLSNRRLTVGVIFGSRSVEHDVSIVTAQQIMRALDPAKYEVIPIYISRTGTWLTGPSLSDIKTFQVEKIEELIGVRETLISPMPAQHGMITPPLAGYLARNALKRLDVAFPAVHGSHGEDGTLQGLLELADIPYVGCGVLASALANDKAMTKAVLSAHGIPTIEGLVIRRAEWHSERALVLERLEALGYPLFIKPNTLGSSIGISRANDPKAAATALEVAFGLDRAVIVEKALEGALEVNCALLGNAQVRASLLEQPISFQEFLTYEEKYLRGGAAKGMKGAERKIPAPLPEALSEQIRQLAIRAFRAIDGRGIARVDFLLKDGQPYVNEINTMPGSLAFYLWQAEGMTPSQVVDELIRLALESYKEKARTIYDYKSGLIAQAALSGLKGVKKL
ncbi:MAG: D-alanine--D-alanine ligase [Candidatus Thermofonsia Clade 1 bacterium]|uniref:D-alanine--D-alanine ligase n=1 Tax=Candidatus Thermofonsia Clade 1 bacterium TaxID=2364210 RepID=A0A2M8PIT1_9CHLR|nr:MAG: D-alanine--D-alanine ligase [Candidatus Thermofonsia Clade 1 bacterium]RMF53916.1 MAG: D-alanine--D-alanine ligase [Chloroflexota bacterium]